MASQANKVSSYFIAHGSPMLALEHNNYTEFLNNLIKEKPDGVVIFTAHWETDVTHISAIDGTYDMIYDFYGFPKPLYEVVYPAKGSVKLAEEVKELLQNNDIKSTLDTERGIDHGAWSLLHHIFSKADVPVVQVSVNPELKPEGHYAIGKALKELKGNILVIGSGVTVHNLRVLDRAEPSFDAEPFDWAVAFDDWLIDYLKKKDLSSLFNYEKLAPNAKKAVPTTEHFVPFFISLGLLDLTKEVEVFKKIYQFRGLSYLGFRFA